MSTTSTLKRQRRETQRASESAGRTQRNASISARGGTAEREEQKNVPPKPFGQSDTTWVLMDECPQMPSNSPRVTVKTSSYILKKFKNYPPSLVIHLHKQNFRFDQQDGSFTYNSPMKIVLEHIKAQTVPHDLIDELLDGHVKFYDGMSQVVRLLRCSVC